MGRKRLDPKQEESAICAIRIPKPLLKRLKKEAKTQGTTLSKYVRSLMALGWALLKQLEKEKNKQSKGKL